MTAERGSRRRTTRCSKRRSSRRSCTSARRRSTVARGRPQPRCSPRSQPRTRAGGLWSLRGARVGVVGAAGAVGAVTLDLLGERGYENVRVFASARSAGRQLGPGTVEEATPDALARGDIDLFLFSVGASASKE